MSNEIEDIEEVIIEDDLAEALEFMGPCTWCVVLLKFPQLAGFCNKWEEMSNGSCGILWTNLIAAFPHMYVYKVAAI